MSRREQDKLCWQTRYRQALGIGKLYGRTFGVQSLREVAISCEDFPWLRKAGAGGVAVALALMKIGLYLIACFLSVFLQVFSRCLAALVRLP